MKRFLSLLCFLTSLSFSAYGEPVDVSIRFWDKTVYHADSPDQAIEVLVTITNKGSDTWRFKLADERSFSIDFDVRSMDNRALPLADTLKNLRISHRPLYFREISLESMESYSFRENVRDYVAIEKSGSYVITLMLYPELYRPDSGNTLAGTAPRNDAVRLVSNRLSLPIHRRQAAAESSAGYAPLDQETGAILERVQLPPDEVISYMLDARIQGQWEKFFLYLDLESMILRDSKRRRTWQSESEEGRQKMLARYREDLMRNLVDGDISTIPIQYTIINTRYSPIEGEIKVHEQFRDGTYISLKEYTYTVKKRDNIWLVTGYTVMNLGVQ